MANQIKAPINYPVIAGGKIVAGGSVLFGQPNVKPDEDNPSTLKAVYLDAALTQPAQNPQGLSSDGVFDQSDTGILFGSNDTVYSIVIKGANKKELSYIPEYDLSDANAAATAQDAAAAAASSEANALSFKNLTEALYTDFTNRYFGAFSSDPSVDDLGNPPNEGSIYFNSTSNVFFTWNGSAWINYFPSNPNGLLVTATGTTTPLALAVHLANYYISVKLFGAVVDGITDDRAAIQACWDYCAANGKRAYHPAGTSLIGGSGNTIDGREYGLLIPDKLNVCGAGSLHSIIKAANNSDMDVITTPRSTATADISLSGFTVDGNQANQTPSGTPNQTLGGFNFWIDNTTRLNLDDLLSKDAAAFGFRIDDCYDVQIGVIRTDHGPDINADGVHFKDTSKVVASMIYIRTEGDDGLIINADDVDCEDYSIGSLIVEAPVTVAAGRGIYISNSEANASAGIQRKVKNINIANAILRDCDATACLLAFAEFENININFVSDNSIVGFGAIVGSTTGTGVTGYIKNCNITGTINNVSQQAILTTMSDGVIEHCSFDFTINDCADGYVGAAMSMKDSFLNLNMNYDPAGTMASPQQGLRCIPSEVFENNIVNLTVNGANIGLEVNSGHTNNTFNIGSITNSVSFDVDFNSGSSDNLLQGNAIASYQNAGTNNKVGQMFGMRNYGRVSTTTDASGNVVIPHGLIAQPDFFKAEYFGGNSYLSNITARDATNLTVRVRDYSGGLVTSSSVQINWEAAVF